MDLVRIKYQQQTGLYNLTQAQRRIKYGICKLITRESQYLLHPSSDVPSYTTSNDLFVYTEVCHQYNDCSLQDNWLLVAHSSFRVVLFDMSKSDSNNIYPITGHWEKPSRTGISVYSYECVNWNYSGTLFTISGTCPELSIVDAETMQTIENSQIPDNDKIFQHKPQPFGSTVIAVASVLRKIPLIDLRTSNVSFTGGQHCNAVKSVAWSTLCEPLLASANENEIFLWDIRMPSQPLSMHEELPTGLGVIPEIRFVPYSNQLVSISEGGVINIYDTRSLTRQMSCDNAEIHMSRARLKFAIVGTSTPPVLFMPESAIISVYNIDTMTIINRLSGHVLPIKIVEYNDQKDELYSAGYDGNIIWLPPMTTD